MSSVVVIGSGFAGLWAALGAARRLDELAVAPQTVDITVISPKPFHDIRVRNYESDLSACRIPVSDVLEPAGIAHITAEVTAIDPQARTVSTSSGDVIGYERLVLASGSRVLKPDIPGLREFGFDVDTYDNAMRLQQHLSQLADGAPTAAARTAVVVGAGLTGIETACELPTRLRTSYGGATPRVVLVDRNVFVGSDMGTSARPVIENALVDNGIEVRSGVGVSAVTEESVLLSSGEEIATRTVVWCAGMRASPLTEQLPVERDRWGRVAVDDYLRVVGVPRMFAAGDVAAARMDDHHVSVMSCQHGRPMGRYAGYNVISDLLGEPMLILRIPWYVTVLDLGPAGAVYTEGWERTVVKSGAEAKATKQTINSQRIYPPLTGSRSDLLAAAAPDLQTRP
ncbi:NAD(P)/FAD-dependent oxidoreductase [Mycobacterium kubicae]|uniref:NAD(P)/FAD-dependent oxidoreductase n=1 Tax=Mycobacterium kubicae TaxID=120959 RepID=UPI0007FC1810|nr:NAD(P)/FAD-dependent oxidoreductase [Mycobacterium kubicae]OBK46901.1 NADH dehydrogenase [Mycobacterium kubicae]